MASLPDRKRGIPLSTMSKTFRDCIIIARRLGVKYVWIDSLCIIQDSEEDWERESVEMGQVYGRALLTVMASGAENENHGCFIARRAAESDPVVIDLIDQEGNRSSVFLELTLLNPNDNGFQPLNERAWTLQERQLSTRNIQYRVGGMFWECNETTWHEWDHLGFTFEDLYLPEEPEVHIYNGRLSDILANSSDEHGSRIIWEMLTEDYSRRKLTKQSDKLPAISAVAKAVHSITKDTYLSGIWKKDIVKGLLWRRKSAEGQKALEWHAPSWSWASMNGSILHYGFTVESKDRTEELQLLEAIIVPSGPDVYGRVSSGKLQIRARVKPIEVRGFEESRFLFQDEYGELKLYANAIIESPGDEDETGYAVLDTTTPRVQHLMLCLVLSSHVDYGDILEDVAETLVLQSVGQYEYERVGVGVDVNARFFDDCEPECLTLV